MVTIFQKIEERPGASVWSWIWRLVTLGSFMYFQPDGIIATLTALSWSFWLIFFVMVIYANLQLVYYFRFTGWMTKEIAVKAIKIAVRNEEFKKDLGFVEKIKIDLKLKDILNKANREYVIKRFHEFMDKNEDRIKKIVSGSLVSTFAFACTPISGARSLPAVAYGTVNLKKGLYAIMAGNTVRIFYMIKVWSMLRNLMGPYFKLAIVVFFVFSIGILAWKPLKSYFQKKNSPESGGI